MVARQLSELASALVAEIAPSATLIIPVGAIEQHGPHLPLGVDALIAEDITRRAATRAAASCGRDFLVAPVQTYGSSHHHLPIAGTLSLRSTTLLALLGDLLGSAARCGFRRIVIVNGHGGNDDLIRQAARDAVLDHPIRVAATSYWTPGWDRLRAIADTHGIRHVPGHAGDFETSMVLALRPDLTGAGRAEAGRQPGPGASTGTPVPHPAADVFVTEHDWIARIGGVTDPASAATTAAGRDLAEAITEALAMVLHGFATAPPD